MDNNRQTLQLKHLIAIIIFVCVIIVLIIFSINRTNDSTSFKISNFDSCVLEMPSNYRTTTFSNIFTKLKETTNTTNKSSSFYSADISLDSCRLVDSLENGRRLTTASFILNIPNLKQSYQVSFAYLRTSIQQSTKNIDLGPISFTCPENNTTYPCELQSPSEESTTNSLDTINQIISPGCTFQTTPSATSKSNINIIITYDPPNYLYHESGHRHLSDFKRICRQRIEQSITASGHNLSDYGFYENNRTLTNPVFQNSR